MPGSRDLPYFRWCGDFGAQAALHVPFWLLRGLWSCPEAWLTTSLSSPAVSQSLPSPNAATWLPSSPRINPLAMANGLVGEWWIFSILPRRSHLSQHGREFTHTQLNQQELLPLLPYIRWLFTQESDPYTRRESEIYVLFSTAEFPQNLM